MAPRGAWWARGGRPCGRRASWRYVWHEVPINGQVINGPSAAGQSTRLSIMGCCNWLFRGSRGLTPWRRCQPGSGATRSEPVFPTKRERPARRRSRHAMAAEALMPPDAARVAIRIATRVATVYTNAPKRHREAISTDLCTLLRPLVCPQQRNSVHKCPETAPKGHFSQSVYTPASPRSLERSSRVATVYTNAPKPIREAISTDLCTLLRRRTGGEAHVASAVRPTPSGR